MNIIIKFILDQTKNCTSCLNLIKFTFPSGYKYLNEKTTLYKENVDNDVEIVHYNTGVEGDYYYETFFARASE